MVRRAPREKRLALAGSAAPCSTAMIRGVIFDLDGVLVSTDELHYRAWSRLAEEEGIPFDRAVNHRMRGISRMASLEVLLEQASRAYAPREKSEMAERKNGYFRALLRTLTPQDALPGARAMLRALRARHIKLAVASASRNTPLIMARVALEADVDAVVDGNDVTRPKPDPQCFLLAARRLGLEPPECLVVEDAAAGIEAGRRAGMAVFGIGTRDRLPGVKHVAENLAAVSIEALLAAGSPAAG
jgi:beta-phosphoglucomutase